MANFETMPATLEKLAATVSELFKEVIELRQQQPVNENPIDSKELMLRLDISEPTLIRMRKRNAIPFLEVAGHYRYVWQDVIKALGQSKKMR